MPKMLVFCLFFALADPPWVPGADPPEVLVILWFDTEDYLLPADDDATLRLADLLSRRGIRATFKLVGEKARVLEKRGRRDVIDALRRHDIGYHSNWHSVHPTVAEYLADAGWADGVAEFIRREGPGADDTRRILGVERLSCYGQPGSSWGPQTLAALPAMRIGPGEAGCYVDEGSHVKLDGKPFWYCGALTVYGMSPNYTRMDLHEEGGLEKGREAFRTIHGRLAADGGGLISIFYHPCEWVHVEFWDGVNFRRGANPPREDWKPPPARSAAEAEAAYGRFEQYIDFQRSLPGVRFVTAGDLPGLYPDPIRRDGIAPETLWGIAEEIGASGAVGFSRQGPIALSAADQLAALVDLLAGCIESGALPQRLRVPSLLGPSDPPPDTEVEELERRSFRDALLDVRNALEKRSQVPSVVYAGAKRIAPADFLAACAAVALHARKAAADGAAGEALFPGRVRVPRRTRLAAEKHIAKDTADLFGGWIIHEEGFRAPRILEQARLQAWTLKPALRGQ